MLGHLPVAIDCNDPATWAANSFSSGLKRIENGRNRIRRALRRCAGASPPPDIGFSSCPAPCEGTAITNYDSVAECLRCLTEDCICTMIDTGFHVPPAPLRGKTRRCQVSVGRAQRSFFRWRNKLQTECQFHQDHNDAGFKTARCIEVDAPDHPYHAQSELARVRWIDSRIRRQCAGVDLGNALNTCGTDVPTEQACVTESVTGCADFLFRASFPEPPAATPTQTRAATATATTSPSGTATATGGAPTETPTGEPPASSTPTPTAGAIGSPTPTSSAGPPTSTATQGPGTPTPTATSGFPGGVLVPYRDTGWRYKVVPYGSLPGFEQPGFDDSDFLTGDAAFGTRFGFCPITNPTDVQTEWPLFTDLLLRKRFTLPAGATDVTVRIGVDNGTQVFINGQDISSGGVSKEGCASLNDFVFPVPAEILLPGDNLLALRANDYGGVSFVDAEVMAAAGSN